MPGFKRGRWSAWCATLPGLVLVSLGAPVVAALAGCASAGGHAPATSDRWLADRGFPSRGAWPSAALHLRGPQLQSTLRLSQLLRRVPEVRLQPTRENPLGLTRILDGEGASCVLGVHLNGVPMVPRGADARVDLDARVGVPDLDALELHLGPEGPVFDLQGCGSLLLWDRSMRHVEDPEFEGSVRVVVTDAPEGPGVGVRLGADGALRPLDADGSCVFEGLLPGAYPVELVVPGAATLRHTARVYAHVESTVELRVQPRRG